jgi:UPF0755 protein
VSRPPKDDWSHATGQDPRDPTGWHEDDHGHHAADHGDYPEDHDPSLADDVLAAHYPEPEEAHEPVPQFRPRRKKRRRNPFVRYGAILLAIAVVAVGGYFGFQAVSSMVPEFSFGGGSEPEDFEGPGTGEVTVEIPSGAGGGQIGRILEDEGVVASAEAFSAVAAADPRATQIQPGTYRMANEMASAQALERLLDPAFRQVQGVTIREGLWKEEVFALLAEATGNEVADYEAVEPETLGLPEAANGNPEGYLFPDTYQFSPTATPQEQLQTMVQHGNQVREQLGVPEEDLQRTVTVASIVQGEAAFAEDLPKVARVIENRLEDGEPLGMDSTIHFLAKERGRAGTTDAQRAEESPYNTYLNTGLPPGPINSPGADAIQAAMDPAEGEWRYFVTINPDSGETVFAETYAEHLENQKLFQEWCRDNPDRC